MIDHLPTNPHDLYTWRELMLQGASEDEPKDEKDKDVPLCVKSGELTIEEANNVRQERIGFHSFVVRGYLRLSEDPVVSLEKLDPETGITVQDPRIGTIVSSKKDGQSLAQFVNNPEWTAAIRKIEGFQWRNQEGGFPSESKG